MRTKMTVVAGEKVAVVAWNGNIMGIATVVKQTPTGTIKVKYQGNEWQYEANGLPKGKARYEIRRLVEGEDASQIVAKQQEEAAAIKAAKAAEFKARQDAADAELAKATDWLKVNARITIVPTVACKLHIVEFIGPFGQVTLTIAFRKIEGYTSGNYSASVTTLHSRFDASLDTGISTVYVDSEDCMVVAARWMRSWVNLDTL